MAKGVQANWIHRGEKRPANPVRRHPAKSVCTRVRMIMILDVDVTAEGGIIKLIAREGNPPPFEPSYNMFGRGRLEDLSLLDLSPLQHEHAFGIMVIGAIEDIPLNPV